MYRIPANRGFTLIELLITIAIAALLLKLAVPSMQGMIEGNAVNKHVTTLMSDLRYARAEAIKSGVPVVVCRSANSENAAPTCAGAGGWSTGWIVFVNRNLDVANDYGAGDTLLRVQGTFADSGGITSSPAADRFVFRPTGLMSTGYSKLTFNSVTSDASRQKFVCISMQGRGRILKTATTACNGADS